MFDSRLSHFERIRTRTRVEYRNIFIGIGGPDAINFSHFIGATYGMERMMGRMDNPLRRILHYARYVDELLSL